MSLNTLFKQFETDPKLEKEGVWVYYGSPEDEADTAPGFLISRAGGANTKFTSAMEARLKPLRRQLQNDMVSNSTLTNITRDVFSQYVLLGWKNIQGEDGQPMDFTKANAVALFTRLPDLYTALQEDATKALLFRKYLQEEDAKN